MKESEKNKKESNRIGVAFENVNSAIRDNWESITDKMDSFQKVILSAENNYKDSGSIQFGLEDLSNHLESILTTAKKLESLAIAKRILGGLS